MKRTLTLLLVVALGAAPAGAQFVGYLALSSDQNVLDCTAELSTVGLVDIYVLHELTDGAKGAEFMVVDDPNLSPSFFIQDILPEGAVAFGNTHSGIGINYGPCLTSPIVVVTMRYYAAGNTTQCLVSRIVPSPLNLLGEIQVVTCDDELAYSTGGEFYWNPDGSYGVCNCFIPAEESTFGHIKAMYQ